MDVDYTVQVLRTFVNELQKLFDAFRGTSLEHEPMIYRRLAKLLHLIAPLLTVVIFYQYMKYLLILNAYEYEESVKKRSGYVRKLSRQLRLLTKRYGNFYFCYMPMNHGTMLPHTQSLFSAIKEVLVNANRPGLTISVSRSLISFVLLIAFVMKFLFKCQVIAGIGKASLRAKAFRVVSTTGVIPENGYFPATRVMRTNLLMDLIHGDHVDAGNLPNSGPFGFGDRDFFDMTDDEGDPLSEINLHIMKCSRELIIQGVKDFDVMSTVFRVMETVTGEEED